ncbi:glycoside hydrolase family 2 [Flexithrix dorotheae]|uniref:glycoside hydrolase family 2 n=1 Tax=Flexithrix dorotheae TaxID=70993 RepID=UPI00037E44D1|nr:glycoside hydrolase family 2 [Flexithrix dorotheae]
MNFKIYKLLIFSVFLSSPLFSQFTQIQYLSGIDKDQTVDWEFFIDNGQNSGKWTTIPVPSNWELQGFGVYNYGRKKMVPQDESDETGQYKYRFKVAEAWKGKTINIVFEGSMTDTDVYINGKSAGPVHQGSFYRFKYDITKLLKIGEENLLEVTVKNWSSNPSVNTAEREADFWLFGGIYRPVYLEALPRQHIEWTAIDAKANGSFAAHIYLKNNKDISAVTGQIQTLSGENIGSAFSASVQKKEDKVILNTKVDHPNLWSPEFPNRYQVVFSIKNNKGIVHTITEKFGFRTVELKPELGIFVNDVKINLKGVNRHSFWPESGRCLSRELSEIDVNLIKEMNMNAVRMSHYPPDVHFLDVCDSLGLFVLDEVTGWQTNYDTEVGRKLVKETVVRDVNHPSIIIWDNGNEGGWNYEIDDDFYLYDPQKRPLIHPWEKFRDTDTQHYIDYDCCVDGAFNSSDIFFPTEFLHGLYDGGHGAGLEDFWNLMQQKPLAIGGFLWVFGDEGVVRTDKNGMVDTNKSNAPDGIVGPYREKEGSFYAIKEIWSPIVIKLDKITKYFEGIIPIENQYLYTNLNQVKFDWELASLPNYNSSENKSINSVTGNIKSPSVAPFKAGELKIDLPENWEEFDVLYLKATDLYNREIFTWSWPVQKAKVIASKQINKESDLVATGEEYGDEIILKANKIELVLEKNSGKIKTVKNNGELISFSGGPVADEMLGESKLKEVKQSKDENDYLVEFIFEEKSMMKTIQYRMQGNGLLKLHYEYLPKGGQYDYIGIEFNYPEEKVTGIKWLGEGPYRVWKNRMRGTKFGIWEKEYNNTITGETLWEYPEFKGYHANLYWATFQTEEQNFTVISETDDIFLKLFTPDSPEGAYNTNNDGVFPKGEIAFMHAISPIGTKFKNADQLGPQGKKNMVHYNRNAKNMKATLYFDFR